MLFYAVQLNVHSWHLCYFKKHRICLFFLCCRSNALEEESLGFKMFVIIFCERQEERTGLGRMSCWTLMETNKASLTWQGVWVSMAGQSCPTLG